MKKYMSVAIMLLLCAGNMIYAISNSPADEDQIKKVVTQFMDGVDNKDIGSLEKVLIDNGTFVDVNNIANIVTRYSTSDLYDKIKSRKLGGWKRDYSIVSVDENSDIAVVKVKVNSSKISQFQLVSLAKMDGSWKIVSSCTTVEKK